MPARYLSQHLLSPDTTTEAAVLSHTDSEPREAAAAGLVPTSPLHICLLWETSWDWHRTGCWKEIHSPWGAFGKRMIYPLAAMGRYFVGHLFKREGVWIDLYLKNMSDSKQPDLLLETWLHFPLILSHEPKPFLPQAVLHCWGSGGEMVKGADMFCLYSSTYAYLLMDLHLSVISEQHFFTQILLYKGMRSTTSKHYGVWY